MGDRAMAEAEGEPGSPKLPGQPTIDVTSIKIEPNPCLIADPLNLEIEFTSDAPIAKPVWDIKYIVDYTNKRREVAVGRVECESYGEGPQKFSFSVPKVDVSEMKKSLLLNVGLLLCVLNDDEAEVIQISMVTQVSKEEDGLHRNIFNPLD